MNIGLDYDKDRPISLRQDDDTSNASPVQPSSPAENNKKVSGKSVDFFQNKVRRQSTLKNQSQLNQPKVVKPQGGPLIEDKKKEAMFRRKIKRIRTQKSKELGPVEEKEERPEEDPNLFKVSESGLEQLSIVESQDLYKDDKPSAATVACDARIK